MSRLAKRPILIPKEIKVEYKDKVLVIKKGSETINLAIHDLIELKIQDDKIQVEFIEPKPDIQNYKLICRQLKLKKNYALLGTTFANINRSFTNIKDGFVKVVSLEGVGFKSSLSGNLLFLSLGYSLNIITEVPTGVSVTIEKNTILTIKSTDQNAVSNFVYKLSRMRVAEPYKGKGVKISGNFYRRKEVKKAK
jgi:large subunit ribosomal protein L6